MIRTEYFGKGKVDNQVDKNDIVFLEQRYKDAFTGKPVVRLEVGPLMEMWFSEDMNMTGTLFSFRGSEGIEEAMEKFKAIKNEYRAKGFELFKTRKLDLC